MLGLVAWSIAGTPLGALALPVMVVVRTGLSVAVLLGVAAAMANPPVVVTIRGCLALSTPVVGRVLLALIVRWSTMRYQTMPYRLKGVRSIRALRIGPLFRLEWLLLIASFHIISSSGPPCEYQQRFRAINPVCGLTIERGCMT
jgi:hypothetical protein